MRICGKRQPERVRGLHQTGSSRWTMGRLGCGEKEAVLNKDVVVESEAKV